MVCWGFSAQRVSRLNVIERAIDRLERSLGQTIPFGMNLIHSPGEPDMEAATVGLYLKRNVRLIEASAFLNLTLPVVRYRVTGIHRDASGRVVAPNRMIAKVSRVEVASKFMAPPPDRFLQELVKSGEISAEQAEWAARIPMAEDITAEADSGGHTDNQPAIVLLPTMLALRDQLAGEYRYDRPVRIGAAGGISTPWAAAAALAMGASYIVTGSVNQSCVEAGTSDIVRRMLAQAQQAEIAMAPAADMFEMGVKVQVLKRGTLFAMRAAKLYELYRTYPRASSRSPPPSAATLEKTVFRAPLETIWEETQAYFRSATPRASSKALRDPKQKMALVFRWYLGMSSHWANTGDLRRAPSTIRSGAGRPWPRSTTGCAARSWKRPKIAVWSRWPEHPLRHERPLPRPDPRHSRDRAPARPASPQATGTHRD